MPLQRISRNVIMQPCWTLNLIFIVYLSLGNVEVFAGRLSDIYSKICSFQYQGPLKESNDFKLVSDQDLGIRGSCPGYQERQNITEEIRSQTDYQSLETVFKRYCVKFAVPFCFF